MSHRWISEPPPAAETYNVIYHVWPEYLIIDGSLRQVGFEIELVGAHTSEPNHLDPACLICRYVRSALCDIANTLIQNSAVAGNTDVKCRVELHDGEIVCSGNRPVVAVSISVHHAHGFDRPTDAAELAVLNAIQSACLSLESVLDSPGHSLRQCPYTGSASVSAQTPPE